MVVGMRDALQAFPNLLFQDRSLDVQFALPCSCGLKCWPQTHVGWLGRDGTTLTNRLITHGKEWQRVGSGWGSRSARCWRCFGSNILFFFLLPGYHVNGQFWCLGSLLWCSPLAKAGQPAKCRRKPLQPGARKPFPPVVWLPWLFCHSRKRHACVLPSFSRGSSLFNVQFSLLTFDICHFLSNSFYSLLFFI